MTWYPVCRIEDLKPGQAASIRIFARPLVVFNVEGQLFGMDGGCLHMKANLAAGELYGEIVACPMHGWEYNVKTGECLTLPGSFLTTRAVKTEDGRVWIEMEIGTRDEG